VLRRLGREGRETLAGQDGARLNAPDWLYKSWCADHGETTARAIVEAHGRRAPLDITVADDQAGWASRLDARLMPTGGLRRAATGPVADLPGYGSGGWWVQDAAAALPARLLGDVRGKQVLDLCAAPGGKTAQLVAAGAQVTAVDLSEKRLRRLHENMERQGYKVETVVGDAATWRAPEPVDAVLLDAPCSGTGTIRRHPDIAWTKAPEDPQRLASLQGRMIHNALENLKPGGLLVFAVCSLQAEEGEAHLGRTLKRRSDVVHEPILAQEIGGLGELINAEGCLRTLPCHLSDLGGVDGFFAMRLRRSGEAGT
jgi:16S rRNA (cytosine967-C5)-methyltransferase